MIRFKRMMPSASKAFWSKWMGSPKELVPRTTVSISHRTGQPADDSFTPSSASSALAPGRAAAMGTHGRDNEGLKPEAADGLGGGVNNPRQAGDAPAAHGDGDPPTGEHPTRQMAGPDPAGDKGGRIIDLGLNELATDTSNRWQIHRCWARYHRWWDSSQDGSSKLAAWSVIAGLALKIDDTVEQPLYRRSFEAPKPWRPQVRSPGPGRLFWIGRAMRRRVRFPGASPSRSPWLAGSQAAQAAWRFLRTCRTRATAPIIPPHASTVAGSGAGTSWITPPWAE